MRLKRIWRREKKSKEWNKKSKLKKKRKGKETIEEGNKLNEGERKEWKKKKRI